jgi:UPF0716 protein FxsA
MSAVWFIVAIILAASDLLLIGWIGKRVGWRWTMVWLLAALILGTSLFRAARAGLVRIARSGDLHREALLRAAGLGLAGVLLAIPGLLSDLAAVLLLLGPVRRGLARKFLGLFTSRTYGRRRDGGPRGGGPEGGGRGGDAFPGQVRDVEFEILDDSRPPGAGKDPGGP